MPVQAFVEGGQVAGGDRPAVFARRTLGVHHFAQRQRAGGQGDGQARTPGLRRQRAAHAALVAGAAPGQEGPQRALAAPAPAALAAGTGIGRQAQVGRGRNRPGHDARQRCECGFGQWRRRDARFPGGGPAGARAQAAMDTAARAFVPGNAAGARPGHHPLVADVGPGIAGFFVRPQGGDARPGVQGLENLDDVTGPHHQRLAQAGEVLAQVMQAFGNGLPLAAAGVGQGPVRRLGHVKRQYRPACRGLDKRRMVGAAQVALEPDKLEGHPPMLPGRP